MSLACLLIAAAKSCVISSFIFDLLTNRYAKNRDFGFQIAKKFKKSQSGVKRLRDEHDRDPTLNAFLVLEVEAG
ncbi:hypothetical protein LPAF129_05290 [Ligilactobacillus pabuli]|uniref:Uncharacterized protein n=1 Tax=Ligilactobacillus pabuli TaxID=2886039 RepID=A0ABQ5JFL4_9LACO|nr:hypothetical protein LPAF129_05290 [Ligilactobacillus pabuli]